MKKILTTMLVCLVLTAFMAAGAIAADKPAKTGCSTKSTCGPGAKAACAKTTVDPTTTKLNVKTAAPTACCSADGVEATAAGCNVTMDAAACAAKMEACPTSAENCSIKGTEACAAVKLASAEAATAVNKAPGCSPKAGAACCTSAPKASKVSTNVSSKK